MNLMGLKYMAVTAIYAAATIIYMETIVDFIIEALQIRLLQKLVVGTGWAQQKIRTDEE